MLNCHLTVPHDQLEPLIYCCFASVSFISCGAKQCVIGREIITHKFWSR